MKWFLLFAWLCLASGPLRADDASGPNHWTIVTTSWGTLFYDPVATGPHLFESGLETYRIKSSRGEVRISGSDVNGYRLTSGRDVLTISPNTSGWTFQWQQKAWTLRSQNGTYSLTTTDPKDSVTFERNSNTFTIKGSRGFLTVHSNPNLLTLTSSAGIATIATNLGSRSFAGVDIHQLPYFGRGVYISFHGVGVLIDLFKLFPTWEVAGLLEWRPILGPAFDPTAP